MHGKFFLVFGLGTLITLLYGVMYTIVYPQEQQKCSMTYMFEFPMFVVSEKYQLKQKLQRIQLIYVNCSLNSVLII